MEWHCVGTACALGNPHHLPVLWAQFPRGREEHSFLLHKGLPARNLSLIPPLPAPLAVQPAEHADVQIQPGMQSCLEGIFNQVCSRVMAIGLTGAWASFSVISWQAGPGTAWHMHCARSTVGRHAAPSPAPTCQDITRTSCAAAGGGNLQHTPASQGACCHYSKELKQQCFLQGCCLSPNSQGTSLNCCLCF